MEKTYGAPWASRWHHIFGGIRRSIPSFALRATEGPPDIHPRVNPWYSAEADKMCQSCGMPMKKDPQGGGTNADGTKSVMYCSFCYQQGVFTAPEIKTVEQMQKLCMSKLKEMRFPGFVAWILTRSIPRLKCWKKQ